jgi:hypothetical protein
MHVLDDLVAGTVRCVFSSAPPATIKKLLDWGNTRPDGERVAVSEVNASQPVSEVVEEILCSLAKAALTVWPDWYGGADLFGRCDEVSLQSAVDRFASGIAAGRQRYVLRPWVSCAASLCRVNTPPITPDFSPAIQLQQLSLAVASDDLTLVVRVSPTREPEAVDLLGLARSLEWVARRASARVVAVLPVEWAGRVELDGISWGYATSDETGADWSAEDAAFDEPAASVSPIRGRPHPDSPGEQLMAARLSRDPVLGPLFEYNMPVTTVRNSRYLVDLVWFGGRIAVEIDGYRCHSSRFDFANDRHRDYELQLSGFLVLRLTHDCVMSDVELAIDKIRDMVNLRTDRALSPRSGA